MDRFSKPEFTSNSYLSLCVCRVGEKTGGHLTRIDVDEGGVKELCDPGDLGALHGIGNGGERSAESEDALLASRVNVQHHAHLREDAGLDKVRDAIGNRPPRVSR